MGKFFAGFLLASSLAAAAYVFVPLRAPSDDPCGERCGEGTVCGEEAHCVPAPPPEEVEDAPTKKKKKRKRGRRGKKADPGGEALGSFKAIDDSRIPQLDRNKAQTIDPSDGSERLTETVINGHLRKLERRFQGCIEEAAKYSDTYVGGGTIRYAFRIEKSGKVSGVSAKAPPALRVFGIIPCTRHAIASHRFPAYDGPPMVIDSSFSVD